MRGAYFFRVSKRICIKSTVGIMCASVHDDHNVLCAQPKIKTDFYCVSGQKFTIVLCSV